MEELEKKHWWNEWALQCPKCKSEDIEPLNLYKGMYKKHIDREKAIQIGLNPDELKNQQKYQCKNCKHMWWENEGIL